MAVIYSYPKLSTLQGKDLLLISDVSSKNKPTMRVELDTITSYVNSQIIAGGTNNYLPVFTTSGLSDSIVRQDANAQAARVLGQLDVDDNLTVAKSVRVNDQLIVGSNFTSIPQRNFIAPGLVAVGTTPSSTDDRPGIVIIGDGNLDPNFTTSYHQLNLFTASDYSDPTNFSDTKAFIYKFNDGYKFARIQAEDGYTIIDPMWEVGDISGETTAARWQVNNGGFARFITPGGPAYFEVTTTGVEINTPMSVAGEIDMNAAGTIKDLLDPTFPQDAATKNYVDNFVPVNTASDYPDDTAAAAGGILVGGLYHTAGVVKIRLT